MNRTMWLVTVFVFSLALVFLVQSPAEVTMASAQPYAFQSPLAPPNDNMDSATVIYSLPFYEAVDVTSATVEPNEPIPAQAYGYINNTIWYVVSPNTSGSLTLSRDNGYAQVMGVYKYDSWGNLTEVPNLGYGANIVFLADAGSTYYIQIGLSEFYGWNGVVYCSLYFTPAPNISINVNPYEPSIFDQVYFFAWLDDPANVPIQSWLWDFGDGTTSTESNAVHQYAADGIYTVQLTVTTLDGRTATQSQAVTVRTRDVAITKFSAPQAAKAGQTRTISVALNSKRYEEQVQVNLYKSIPGDPWAGGFVLVGTSTQFVPVRSGNRTTEFSFNYTFTPDDAAVGKVTFKAVAQIVNGQDALPADNEAIADPTKVSE